MGFSCCCKIIKCDFAYFPGARSPDQIERTRNKKKKENEEEIANEKRNQKTKEHNSIKDE